MADTATAEPTNSSSSADTDLQIIKVQSPQATTTTMSAEERRRRQNALLAKLNNKKRRYHDAKMEDDIGSSSNRCSSSTACGRSKFAKFKEPTKSGVEHREEDDDGIEVIEHRIGKEALIRRKAVAEAKSAVISEFDDEMIRRKAAETLIRESKRSAQRAEMYGPQGWLKPRAMGTNKVFLARTLQSVELQRRDHEAVIAPRRKDNDDAEERALIRRERQRNEMRRERRGRESTDRKRAAEK